MKSQTEIHKGYEPVNVNNNEKKKILPYEMHNPENSYAVLEAIRSIPG